jgi:hypothetical protein
MNEEIRDLLGRISTVNASLDSLSDNINNASKAMGKAVEYVNSKMGGGSARARGGAAGAEAALREQIKKLEAAITFMAGKMGGAGPSTTGLESKIDDQIEQGKQTVEAITRLANEFKKDSRTKKKAKVQTDRMLGLQENLIKALQDNSAAVEKFSADAAASGTRPIPIPGAPTPSGAGAGGSGGGSPPPRPPGGGRNGGGPEFNPDEWDKAGRDAAKKHTESFADESKRKLASWMTEISTLLIGGYGNIGQALFAGSMRDITDFRKEARKIAFEVDGIGESARGMQAEFANMGDVARQTGKSVDVMQKLYLANMRKGFKGQGNELKKVLKSGMHMSTMIGSNVDETGTMFADWNRSLGMSVDKMAQLADDAKDIARTTGVTGDELLQAMKSSEGILKNLRNQGNLTNTSAKNVIEAMTMAKKLGIEDKAAGVLDMMTSTNKFLDGDAKTRSFILKMAGNLEGGTQAALNGTMMNDPKMIKGFVSEMNKTIDQFTNGRAKTVEDMEKLSDDERTRLSVLLGKTFGLEMYEFKGMFDALSEQSKTLEDKFKTLEGEASNVNESFEKQELARKKMNELMISSGMSFANRFTEQARKVSKDGKSFDDVMKDVSKSMTDADRKNMDTMMKRSGIDASKTAGLGESRDYVNSLLVAADAMQKRGKDVGKDVKDFGPELIKAAEKAQRGEGSGDLTSLADEMRKVGNELDVEAQSKIDPTVKLGMEITALNETIRKLVSGPFGMLIDVLGWVGLALAHVGLGVGVLYLRFGSVSKGLTEMADSFGKLRLSMRSFVDKISGAGFDKNKYRELRASGRTAREARAGAKYNFFSRIADGIADGAQKVSDVFGGLIRRIENGFSRLSSGINKFFRSPMRFLQATTTRWYRSIFNAGGIIDRVIARFRSLWGGLSVIGDYLGGKVLSSLGKVANTLMGIGRGTGGALMAAATSFKNFRIGILSGLSAFNWRGVVSGIIRGIGTVASGFVNVLTKVLRGGITGIISGIKALVLAPLYLVQGSFKGLSLAFRALGNTVRKMPIIGWLLMAVDGVMGAMDGYKRAGDMFGVKTNELTQGMKMSAGAAGATVGILDGLSFGLLRATGAMEPMMKFLSKFYYGFVILGDGIKKGFMSWMPAIQESFSHLGKALGDLWATFASIFGYDITNESEGWKAFYEIMGTVGQAIGWLVGGALKLLIDTLWLITKAVQGVVWYFKMVIKSIAAVGEIFYNLFTGNWTYAGLVEPLVKVFGTVVEGIRGLFAGVIDWLWSKVTSLWSGKKTPAPTPTPTPAPGPTTVPQTPSTTASPGTATITVPTAAQGAIATEPTLAMVGDGKGINKKEVMLPVNKLDGMLKNNKIKNTDFSQDKSISIQKRNADASVFSTAYLKNMDSVIRRGRSASEGIYVQDMRAGLMLNLLLNHIDLAIEKLDAMLIFMGEKDPEAMKKAMSEAKLSRVGRMTEAAVQLKQGIATGKTSDEAAIDNVYYALKESATAKMGLSGDAEKEYVKKRVKVEEQSLQALKDLRSSSEELTGDATRPGSIYTNDLHRVPYEKQALKNDKKSMNTLNKMEENTGFNGEQNHHTIPEFMWNVEDKVANAMEKQKEAYAASSGFEESAQMASVEGLKARGIGSIEYGDGQSMSIQDAMNKANAQLNDAARARYQEDNKGQIEGLDKTIKDLKKKVIDESNMAGNKGKGLRDMPSYKALEEAYAQKDKFASGEVPEQYFKENTMMAGGLPGEDPNLLYESRGEAVTRYQGKAEQEKALIASESKRLEGLKAKRKEVRGRRGWLAGAMGIDPDKDELASIDKKILEIEGKNASGGSTDASVGSLELAQGRLKHWEREAKNPSSRAVIGKNEWTGDSDTSVIFPEQNLDEAIDWHKKSGDRMKDGKTVNYKELRQTPEIEWNESLGYQGEDSDRDSLRLDGLITRAKELALLSGIPTGDKMSFKTRGDVPVQIEGQDINPDVLTRKELDRVVGALTVKDSMSGLDSNEKKLMDVFGQARQKRISADADAAAAGAAAIGPNSTERMAPAESAVGSAAHAMEQSSTALATPVGQHAVPVMREDSPVASVQPIDPRRTYEESMLRDKAESESGSGKLQSDELARIEEVSYEQFQETHLMREGIEELVRMMKASGSVGSGVDHEKRTDSTKTHFRPNRYGKIQDGKPGAGPNRNTSTTKR